MSLAQLSQLLPLPEEDLQQVLSYALALSKDEAASHFANLLGESPQSIEFISAFNARRTVTPASTSAAPTTSTDSGVPKATRKPPKKKAPLHALPPRQVQDTYAASGTAYVKKDEDEYVSTRPAPSRTPAAGNSRTSTNAFSLETGPAAKQAPTKKLPPSAAGSLISDFKTSKSASSSRNASPNPTKTKTKVNITGGTSMHGASTVLNDLDAAIRTLEISTNSSLLPDSKARACNCIATRHPLLTAAPNCLNCGKVICVKEGLGPCTFCNTPLLSAVEIQSMISSLREERGREKMLLDNASHRRAEISQKPAPFTKPRDIDLSPAELKAKEHRDKLLNFQAQNARRTTVHDEAADFDTDIGKNAMWASPVERARQLKRQQQILAEQEWNARPEYEKRRQVVSIDVVKGKVVKRMAAVERPAHLQPSEEEDDHPDAENGSDGILQPVNGNSGYGTGTGKGRGTYSSNPLLGNLIKPVWKSSTSDTDDTKGRGKGKGKEDETTADSSTLRDDASGDGPVQKRQRKTWRRVQDDLDDNEAVILDGGVYGSGGTSTGKVEQGSRLDREEPDCG